jgi:hypothetical protein
MKAAKEAACAEAAVAAEQQRQHIKAVKAMKTAAEREKQRADDARIVEELMNVAATAAEGLTDFDRAVWLGSSSPFELLRVRADLEAELPDRLSKKDARNLFELTDKRLPPGEKCKFFFAHDAQQPLLLLFMISLHKRM